MATINIAFGGQNIGVEIPDIALEVTMQDVLTEARQQTAALSGLAQKFGIELGEVKQSVDSSGDQVTTAVDNNTKETNRLGNAMSGLTQGMNNVQNAAMGLKGDEKMSSLVSGAANALGLGMIGAQVGSLFGIMEEFGASMGALRRVGTGYLENLQDLRGGAAEVGLGLERFGQIVTENGVSVRALGKNTTDGAMNLITMNKELRNATRNAGFFGMSSQEMTLALVDEAEIRRRIHGLNVTDVNQKRSMVQAVAEQLKMNEAMAKLTGQDIRDRIKASQTFRSDATNAAILSQLNGDQAVAAKSAVEALSALGPTLQGPAQQAITNILGGFDMFANNEEFAQFAQMAQAAGVDVRGAFSSLAQQIEEGGDAATLNATVLDITRSLKQIDPQMLITQSLAGNAGAGLVLESRMESVSDGADSFATSIEKITKSIEDLNEAITDGETGLAGTQAEMERGAAQFRDQLMDSLLKSMGAGDLATSADGFNKFVTGMANITSNQGFKTFVDELTNLVTLTSGAQAIGRMIAGEQADAGQLAFLAAAGLDAAGLEKFAAAARVGGLALSADDIAASLTNLAPVLGSAFSGALEPFKDAAGNLKVAIQNLLNEPEVTSSRNEQPDSFPQSTTSNRGPTIT